MSRKIWLFCKDPGGTKGAAAVYHELVKRGYEVSVFASGAAPRFLGDIPHWHTDSVEHAAMIMARSDRPDIVITTMDSPGGVGPIVVRMLQAEGLDIVFLNLSDYPVSGALKGEWANMRPDFITAGGREGVVVIMRAWPDFEPSRIIVTGYPAFDRLANMDVAAKRREVRQALGMPEKTMMIALLTDIETAVPMVEDFTRAFVQLPGATQVAVRAHPRMKDEAPEQFEALMKASSPFAGQAVETSHLQTDEVTAASDVIFATYSTANGEGAAMRIPTVNWEFPYAQAWFEKATGGIAPEGFPWTIAGVCPAVHNTEELLAIMREAGSGDLRRRLLPIQKERLHLDGKNAMRAADLVVTL